MRGHGESGVDPSAPSGPDGTLAFVGGDGVTLVGGSCGGQVVMEVARTAPPTTVRGLVPVDAAPLTTFADVNRVIAIRGFQPPPPIPH